MPMKYVMLRVDGGDLVPLLFPEFMQHSLMAASIPATAVSAGFVSIRDGKVLAGGSSGSLGLSSRDQDSEIIQGYLDGDNVIQRER